MEGALAYAEHFIKDIARQWFDCPIELQTRFQKVVFPYGIPYDQKNGFRTVKMGCIFELNRQFQLNKSLLVDPSGFEPLTSSVQVRRSTN